MKEILNPLKKHLDKQLLRYAVQHAIFCPGCGTVMDVRRAALLSIRNPRTGTELFCRALCEECVEGGHETTVKAAAKAKNLEFEIVRGYRLAKRETPEQIRAKEERKADRMAKSYEDRFTGNLFANR